MMLLGIKFQVLFGHLQSSERCLFGSFAFVGLTSLPSFHTSYPVSQTCSPSPVSPWFLPYTYLSFIPFSPQWGLNQSMHPSQDWNFPSSAYRVLGFQLGISMHNLFFLFSSFFTFLLNLPFLFFFVFF